MTVAIFVLGLQCFEMMAVAAVGNNLITYLLNEMHFPLSKSANTVTNFVGTIFLLSLLGGFLSDSYLGSLWTMLIFGFVELSGFILLSIQAHVEQLLPPKCSSSSMQGGSCEEAKGYEALIFYVALYLVALGRSEEQHEETEPKQGSSHVMHVVLFALLLFFIVYFLFKISRR